MDDWIERPTALSMPRKASHARRPPPGCTTPPLPGWLRHRLTSDLKLCLCYLLGVSKKFIVTFYDYDIVSVQIHASPLYGELLSNLAALLVKHKLLYLYLCVGRSFKVIRFYTHTACLLA